MADAPTPAVLPDARAVEDAFTTLDVYLAAYADRPGAWPVVDDDDLLTFDVLRTILRSFTPPASDAAVPAELLREAIARKLCEQQGGDPEAIATDEHDCWEGALWTAFVKDADDILALTGSGAATSPVINVICEDITCNGDPCIAAAPKAASDTGAGLREAAEMIVGWLQQEQDRLDAESGDYLMDTDDCINVIREKIAATPTDATDGATGGGETDDEAPCTDCRDTGMTIQTERPCSCDAGDQFRATTPGGDLLEQAAREKVELLFDQAFADGVAVGKSGDDSILAGSSSAYAQAAIRALKPAGDGGEA